MDDARLEPERQPDEVAQTRRQFGKNVLVRDNSLLGQSNPALFGGSLGAAQFAFIDGTLEEQPGSSLHKPGRQTHAFDRIGDCRRARQKFCFLAAIAIEIARRPGLPNPFPPGKGP